MVQTCMKRGFYKIPYGSTRVHKVGLQSLGVTVVKKPMALIHPDQEP